MSRKITWKCSVCGMLQRKEPLRSLSDHMKASHDMVWSDAKETYVQDNSPKNAIDIKDVRSIKGRVFRVVETKGNLCKSDLWCRLDWADDDWRLTFFDSFRGADHSWKPLESLNSKQMKLAHEAIQYSIRLTTEDD